LEIRLLDVLSRSSVKTVELSKLARQIGVGLAVASNVVTSLVSAEMVTAKGDDEKMRVTIAAKGEDYYQDLANLDEANSETCVLWLRRGLTLSRTKARSLFAAIEEWYATAPLNDMVAYLGGSEEPLEKAQEEVKSGLRLIQRSRRKPGKPVSDLYLRALGHLAASFAIEALKDMGGRPKRVLVDTNVLLDLLDRSKESRGSLNELAMVLTEAPETEFIIAYCTLKELMSVFQSIEYKCNMLDWRGVSAVEARIDEVLRELRDRDELVSAREIHNRLTMAHAGECSRDTEKETDPTRGFGPLVHEFFTSEAAPPTFRDYRDGKVLEILGVSPLGGKLCKWKPCVLDIGSGISALVDSALKKLKTIHEWKWRSDSKERHDVELVLYATEKNSSDLPYRYVVWTTHKRLPVLAEHIGADPEVVLFGPGLQADINCPGDVIRDYLLHAFLSAERRVPHEIGDLRRALRGIRSGQRRRSLSEVLVRVLSIVRAGTTPHDIEEGPSPGEIEWGPAEPIVASVPKEILSADSNLLHEIGWIDMSIDWALSPGGHSTPPLRIFWGGQGEERGASQWQICPHAVTHMDLPWALDELPALATKGDKRIFMDHPEAQRHLLSLATPRTSRAIFTAFTDLADETDARNRHDAGSDIPPFSGEQLAEFIRQRRIGVETFQSRIPSSLDLEGALLVIHTGWTCRFAPKGDDISSLFWEGMHPWLVHPWLDKPLVTYLAHRGISGIAIDAPMADCPIYVASRLAPQNPEIRKAAAITYEEEFNGVKLPPRQPAHVKFLGDFSILIEALDIPREVEQWYPDGSSHFETDVFTSGLHFHLLPDALMIKFLAKDPRRRN